MVTKSDSSRLNGSNLSLSIRALFKLSHLLPLYRRSSNFLTKNDVSDFTTRQRCDIDTVPLSEVLMRVKATFSQYLRRFGGMLTARIRSFKATSTFIHSSSERVGHTKWGSVIVDLSGRKMIFAFSLLT